MRRFFPYFSYLHGVKLVFIAGLACGIVGAVASNFGLPVMADFVFPRILGEQAVVTGGWELLLYTAIFPAVFLVRAVSMFFNVYFVQYTGVRVLERLRLDLFRKLQDLPLSFFHDKSTGDLLSRSMADTAQLQFTLTNVASDAIRAPIALLTSIAALVYLSVKNSDLLYILLALASIPACVFPVRAVGRRLRRRSFEAQSQLGRVSERLTENFNAIREVRAFGLESSETAKFAGTVRSLLRLQMKVVKYNHFISPTIEVISAAGVALALYYAARAGVGLETFMPVALALYFSYEPVKKLGMVHNELQKGLSALDRIETVLHEPISIADPEDPVDVGRLRGEIVFEAVDFSYGESPVLQNISARIPAGCVCALVGPSGAGKTTFAHLVPRFYEVTCGSVRIDGIDVRRMRLQDLRRNVAFVSQDPVLFNDTVYNNILVGRSDATRAEVEEACRNAYAHDFITALPLGYETVVGERGSLLSGGQKQRLAIARAFLRNAPILILDEATSALDGQSEDMIQAALDSLVRGKTVLIIAHRFSTIRNASMIQVFHEGRIVASGSHENLYGSSGLYRALYDRQN